MKTKIVLAAILASFFTTASFASLPVASKNAKTETSKFFNKDARKHKRDVKKTMKHERKATKQAVKAVK